MLFVPRYIFYALGGKQANGPPVTPEASRISLMKRVDLVCQQGFILLPINKLVRPTTATYRNRKPIRDSHSATFAALYDVKCKIRFKILCALLKHVHLKIK